MLKMFDPALIQETDYGTPRAMTDVQVTLTIDGQSVKVAEGTSVYRAAAELGVLIPKLCATDSLDAFGSCRLCVVEIEGMRGKPASCTTPVAEGMVVTTQTEALADLRRNVMELYISDHPLDCLTRDGKHGLRTHYSSDELCVAAELSRKNISTRRCR